MQSPGLINSGGVAKGSGSSAARPGLVVIRAGHVVAAGRSGTEKLALALDKRGSTVGADAFGTFRPCPRRFRRFFRRLRRGLSAGEDGGRRAHEAPGPFVGVDAGPEVGRVADDSGPVFKMRPAGVLNASIGVVSGVGTGAGVCVGARRARPWPPPPQAAAATVIRPARRPASPFRVKRIKC
jgi:hypothetical protein